MFFSLFLKYVHISTQMCPANGREHRTHPHTERAIVCVLGFLLQMDVGDTSMERKKHTQSLKSIDHLADEEQSSIR